MKIISFWDKQCNSFFVAIHSACEIFEQWELVQDISPSRASSAVSYNMMHAFRDPIFTQLVIKTRK